MARTTLTLLIAVAVALLAACEEDVKLHDRAGTVDSIGPATFDGAAGRLAIAYSTWDPEGGELTVITEFAVADGAFGDIGPGRVTVFSEHARSTEHVLVWTTGEGLVPGDTITVRLSVEGRESAPATLGPFVPAELASDPEPRPDADVGLDAAEDADAEDGVGDAADDTTGDSVDDADDVSEDTLVDTVDDGVDDTVDDAPSDGSGDVVDDAPGDGSGDAAVDTDGADG